MISRDILFYTLAVCAAAMTVCVVWFFVYILKIFRNVAGLVDDFRGRLSAIDDILHTIKDKLTNTHAELTLLAAGLKELMGFFAAKRAANRPKTRPSRSEDDL